MTKKIRCTADKDFHDVVVISERCEEPHEPGRYKPGVIIDATLCAATPIQARRIAKAINDAADRVEAEVMARGWEEGRKNALAARR
jgi:hypothetical protein